MSRCPHPQARSLTLAVLSSFWYFFSFIPGSFSPPLPFFRSISSSLHEAPPFHTSPRYHKLAGSSLLFNVFYVFLRGGWGVRSCHSLPTHFLTLGPRISLPSSPPASICQLAIDPESPPFLEFLGTYSIQNPPLLLSLLPLSSCSPFVHHIVPTLRSRLPFAHKE